MGVLLLAALAGSGGADQARAQNSIALVHQESPADARRGNTLSIDQSLASGARIIGPALGRNVLTAGEFGSAFEPAAVPLPAAQIGVENQARILQEGVRPVALVLQTPIADGTGGIANSLTIASTGDDARGGVVQIGSGNQASLTLSGDHARGLVTQAGSDNSAALTVGSGALGVVTQVGRNNATGSVTVAPGSRLSYSQLGTNLQPIGQTGLEAMSTNPGMITVRQTGW